jgi:hypothetical protein
VKGEAIVLYWKLEDVLEGDGESPHSADVGPAWLYLPNGSEQPIRDGEWITRADAQELAAKNGYELQADDGFE